MVVIMLTTEALCATYTVWPSSSLISAFGIAVRFEPTYIYVPAPTFSRTVGNMRASVKASS